MVRAVRAGRSVRSVATAFGVSVGTVTYWVQQARGQRLDRVNFADRKPGRASNRTPAQMEQRILSVRRSLRDASVLGEYGSDAIGLALAQDSSPEQVPSRSTIYRVLERHGMLDGTHRQRRPAPPKGWYLPALAHAQAELDSFDFIEDLKIGRRTPGLGAHRHQPARGPGRCLDDGAPQCKAHPRSPGRAAGAATDCPPTRSSTTTRSFRAHTNTPTR